MSYCHQVRLAWRQRWSGSERACEKVPTWGSSGLYLTEDLHGSGCIVVVDSWFGSVKSAIALLDNELYSVMLVKTAHKRCPREKLVERKLNMGKWESATATLDGQKLLVVFPRFRIETIHLNLFHHAAWQSSKDKTTWRSPWHVPLAMCLRAMPTSCRILPNSCNIYWHS